MDHLTVAANLAHSLSISTASISVYWDENVVSLPCTVWKLTLLLLPLFSLFAWGLIYGLCFASKLRPFKISPSWWTFLLHSSGAGLRKGNYVERKKCQPHLVNHPVASCSARKEGNGGKRNIVINFLLPFATCLWNGESSKTGNDEMKVQSFRRCAVPLSS